MKISSNSIKIVFKAKEVAVHSFEFVNAVFERYESKTTGQTFAQNTHCVYRKSVRSGKCKKQKPYKNIFL